MLQAMLLAHLLGDYVFQGDPGNAVYIVESGMLRVYVHAEEGQ